MSLLKIGTRKSRLALWQTDHVIERLLDAWPGLTCEKVSFVTQGDKSLDKPLSEIGGKGLFTLELENALRHGRIDLAVHSLKDLPVEQPDDLTLGAILGRADVRDILVAKNNWTLETLPHGARVGTSSLRRRAQLLAIRSDLNVCSIRGNVETRVRKVLETDEFDAAVLAAAGVLRLGLEICITDWLDLDTMLPAPGQGALAVQCRKEDEQTLLLLQAIERADVRACVSAERTFLSALGGGCATPVAAYARYEGDAIRLQATVAATDGSRQVDVSGLGADPIGLGRSLAAEALARGASQILSPSPLQGRRILVTRSADQAADLAARLQARGAEPVVFPVIAFQALPTERLDAALARIEEYSWLIFTSVNAVDFFFAVHSQQPLPKIAAVGSATRAKLQERGIRVGFVPETFTGEQLALGLGNLAGKRVLLPRARIGRPEIVELLRAHGAAVDDVPLYQTVPVVPAEGSWVELETGIDMITFTSPSSVRSFLENAANSRAARLIKRAAVACIGPSTAAEAEMFGLTVAVTPDEYTIDGLIDAIERYYA